MLQIPEKLAEQPRYAISVKTSNNPPRVNDDHVFILQLDFDDLTQLEGDLNYFYSEKKSESTVPFSKDAETLKHDR